MNHLATNFYEAASVILFGIGFMNLLLQNNLIKKFIGLNIMDTAVYLFLAAKGYIFGRVAPILTNGVVDADYYINRSCADGHCRFCQRHGVLPCSGAEAL